MDDIYPGIRLEDLSEDEENSEEDEDSDDGNDSLKLVERCSGDERLTDVSGDASVVDDEAPPKGVSLEIWQKFQQLQQRRAEIKSRSVRRNHRRRTKGSQKRDQNTASEKSDQSLDSSIPCTSHTSTKSASVMGADEPTTSTVFPHRSTETSTKTGATQDHNVKTQSQISSQHQTQGGVEKWADFRPYLGVNDHMKGVDRGKYAPKTGLEKKIDCALSEGDFKKAEDLSDYLSTREFGEKIAGAIDAKRYAEKRKKEDELKAAKKKKKLNWGFQHKQRWETKGNM